MIVAGGDLYETEKDLSRFGISACRPSDASNSRCKGGDGRLGNQRHDLRLLCVHSAVCTGSSERGNRSEGVVGNKRSRGEIRSRRG